MSRLFYLFVAASQLTTTSFVVGAGDGDETYLRARKPPQLDDMYDGMPIEPHEIESTRTLLSDYEFTRTLRDALQGPRRLADDDTCRASGASCENHTSNCCQGGCNSKKKCFCQDNGGMCFNFGKDDKFCCSNRCGKNGRCQPIRAGESCAVGDGYCRGNLMCGENKKCVPKSGPVQTPKPTRKPTKKPTSGGSPFCQPANRICFNKGKFDLFCCSKKCGSNGQCEGAAPETAPKPTPKPTRKPVRKPTRKPTKKPTPYVDHTNVFQSKSYTNSAFASGGVCANPNHIQITVEIETDQFGADTSWSIAKLPNNANHNANNNAKLYNVPEGTYGLFTYDEVNVCVPPGQYNFTITDKYGDGICCAYGDGYVKIHLDNREVMHVKSYGKGLSETLNVGYDPNPEMTDRDYLYLEAHNARRMTWYAANSVSNVPLVYSPRLAEESRIWAEKLLVNCSSAGIEHEPGVPEGENLAKNTGAVDENGLGWGQLYAPDKIVGRWVEWEVERDYPGNAHLTQALWRGAKYLGCGESVKEMGAGYCRVQVCRYARAGNCEMSRFDATEGRNWLPPMIADTSRCGPDCPPEGCF